MPRRCSWVRGSSLRAQWGIGASRSGRDVAQRRVLADVVHHVDAEAVDAAVEPEAQHVVHGATHLGVAPVQVGLLGQEGVQVALPGGRRRRSRPGLGAKAARQLLGAPPSGAGSRHTYQSRLGRCARRRGPRRTTGAGSEVWFGHPVDDHPQAALVGLGEQAVEVVEGPEERVDVAVVGDVVAEVGHGRAEERREPDGVDAEPGEVVEVRRMPGQVAHAVAVGVGEGAGVDLVDDAPLPPGRLGFGLRPRHGAQHRLEPVSKRSRAEPRRGRRSGLGAFPRQALDCGPARRARRRARWRSTTAITRLLGVDIPIVQAPMGWIARAQLASAVSNAGGLGIIETSSGRARRDPRRDPQDARPHRQALRREHRPGLRARSRRSSTSSSSRACASSPPPPATPTRYTRAAQGRRAHRLPRRARRCAPR